MSNIPEKKSIDGIRQVKPARPAAPGALRRAEQVFETSLWQSRFFLIIAVVASALLWLVMLFITTVDVVYLLGRTATYADPALGPAAREALRLQLIDGVVGTVDGYLIASTLFIFALGLYKQFISRLEIAERSEFASRLLDIRTFDELKGHLSRMIVLILIVKFLQQALKVEYTTTLDLLYFGIGVLLIGGATYLSHLAHQNKH